MVYIKSIIHTSSYKCRHKCDKIIAAITIPTVIITVVTTTVCSGMAVLRCQLRIVVIIIIIIIINNDVITTINPIKLFVFFTTAWLPMSLSHATCHDARANHNLQSAQPVT